MEHAAESAANAHGTLAPEDAAWQDERLQEVSRTFALTIPELPESLRLVVGNAYLLCRIADTIEDSPSLPAGEKRRLCELFSAAVAGEADARVFARQAQAVLDDETPASERRLVAETERALRIAASFSPEDRAALARCVRIMARGMSEFQEGQFAAGLRDQAHLDSYCYHVAGVVGEMLTDLFCAHSGAIAKRREELAPLAVSFGQGLQMTNILKDMWDDRKRGACWLPRQTFAQAGCDLDRMGDPAFAAAFEQGLERVIGNARGHLEDALRYTLAIPPSEQGVRRFCLWALGMAVLTLRKINRRRSFRQGGEVKISRRSVFASLFVIKTIARSNTLLRWVFHGLARPLPSP